jgi:hypothetical protein
MKEDLRDIVGNEFCLVIKINWDFYWCLFNRQLNNQGRSGNW